MDKNKQQSPPKNTITNYTVIAIYKLLKCRIQLELDAYLFLSFIHRRPSKCQVLGIQ